MNTQDGILIRSGEFARTHPIGGKNSLTLLTAISEVVPTNMQELTIAAAGRLLDYGVTYTDLMVIMGLVSTSRAYPTE